MQVDYNIYTKEKQRKNKISPETLKEGVDNFRKMHYNKPASEKNQISEASRCMIVQNLFHICTKQAVKWRLFTNTIPNIGRHCSS